MGIKERLNEKSKKVSVVKVCKRHKPTVEPIYLWMVSLLENMSVFSIILRLLHCLSIVVHLFHSLSLFSIMLQVDCQKLFQQVVTSVQMILTDLLQLNESEKFVATCNWQTCKIDNLMQQRVPNRLTHSHINFFYLSRFSKKNAKLYNFR